jgi:hypothetical protein
MAYTTIDKPDDYFNTKLHTGDGGGSGSSTGIGFQPDMVWSKSRTEALNHTLFDSVRGAGSNKELTPNGAGTEGGADSAGFGYISAFNSDGYSWTAGSTNTENFNKSSQTYANWCWKANGAGSANTDGDVTSTVSVNTTPGFSIVKWDSTGTAGINIGHGLGQKPAMIIAKCLNQSSTSWPVYHQSLGATKYLSLQATTAANTSATRWNNSEPTTTTFQTGSSGDIGGSDRTMIAYCFAEKQGYSKFGSYTGNSSTDGTFVYTGFRPAWVLIKVTNTASNWFIQDNKRLGFNASNSTLNADLSDAESSTNRLDILSNGFKLRNTSGAVNSSANTYIYMAFAENPLVGTNNIPATAR